MEKGYFNKVVKVEMARLKAGQDNSKSKAEEDFFRNRREVQGQCFADVLGITMKELEEKLARV